LEYEIDLEREELLPPTPVQSTIGHTEYFGPTSVVVQKPGRVAFYCTTTYVAFTQDTYIQEYIPPIVVTGYGRRKKKHVERVLEEIRQRKESLLPGILHPTVEFEETTEIENYFLVDPSEYNQEEICAVATRAASLNQQITESRSTRWNQVSEYCEHHPGELLYLNKIFEFLVQNPARLRELYFCCDLNTVTEPITLGQTRQKRKFCKISK
jgi:hypothetical protein